VVTITPEAGETRIHIEERQELAGWRLFIPGWGAALGALTTLPIWTLVGDDPNPILLALTLGFAVAGGVTTANLILWTGAQRKHPQLEQLADRLATVAERAARPGLAGPARDPRSLPR
jgi:Na+/melibiose symporter-like transporter